jgi:hypothetical protein
MSLEGLVRMVWEVNLEEGDNRIRNRMSLEWEGYADLSMRSVRGDCLHWLSMFLVGDLVAIVEESMIESLFFDAGVTKTESGRVHHHRLIRRKLLPFHLELRVVVHWVVGCTLKTC